MTRVFLAPETGEDFERILAHLEAHESMRAADRIEEILHAIDILQDSPEIGRPVEDGLRELIIGKGSTGYVALYRYMHEADTVFVLALQSQKELEGDE